MKHRSDTRKRKEHPGTRALASDSNDCIYCGQHGECWDHAIPYILNMPTLLVRSCFECNGMASDNVYLSIVDKQEAIFRRLEKRYAALLVPAPEWDEDDLDSVSYQVRVMVMRADVERRKIRLRLTHTIPKETIDAIEKFDARRHREEIGED